jgi:hypothetical protein
MNDPRPLPRPLRTSPLTSAWRVAVTALLAASLLFAACESETDAVDPWLEDVPPQDGAAEVAADAQADSGVPAGTWQLVDAAIESKEKIMDGWSYLEDESPRVIFVTNAGRYGRLSGAEEPELKMISGAGGQLPYRGIHRTDDNVIWVVGHENTIHRWANMWYPVDVTEEDAGDWNAVWSDGTSVTWVVGEAGAILRMNASGEEKTRFTSGDEAWLCVIGDATHAWFVSATRVLKVAHDIAAADLPVAGEHLAADGQAYYRAWKPGAGRVYLTGKPKQLQLDDGEAMSFSQQLSSGINAYFDVHGPDGGPLLAVGEAGAVSEVKADGLHELGVDGLPPKEGFERVWSFDGGAAYILTQFGDVYYLAP